MQEQDYRDVVETLEKFRCSASVTESAKEILSLAPTKRDVAFKWWVTGLLQGADSEELVRQLSELVENQVAVFSQAREAIIEKAKSDAGKRADEIISDAKHQADSRATGLLRREEALRER